MSTNLHQFVIPKKSNLKRKKSKSITQLPNLNHLILKVSGRESTIDTTKDTPKRNNKKTPKKKEVLFSLLPQLTKLSKIRSKYIELLNQNEKKREPNFSISKKRIESNKSEDTSSQNLKTQNSITNSNSKSKPIRKKLLHSNTIKNIPHENPNLNNPQLNNLNETLNRSFDEVRSHIEIPNYPQLKKNSSEKNLITPIPENRKLNDINAEKIKRFSKMLRRQEYTVQLKKKTIKNVFGKRVIFIQRTWRKFFKKVYLRKVKIIQKFYRGHLVRRLIKNDRLIIIRFVVKLSVNGRKKHFHFFVGQMKKLIRAIFFQNTILTKDISIQVDIPIEKNYYSNNLNNTVIEDSFNSEKFSESNQSIESIKSIKQNINNEGYIETIFEKMKRLQGDGNIIGVKNFPRPYCEIGCQLNALLRRVLKQSVRDDNIISIENDMKYSGKTNQLIEDFSNKRKVLYDIQYGDNNNYRLKYINKKGNKVIKMNEDELENEIKDKKTFLKSKNIQAEEYNILKSEKYVNLIRKRVVYNKWNIFTKNHYTTIGYSKLFLIQKNMKSYLKKKNEEIEDIKVKKNTKKKLFRILLKENILNHVRKYVVKKLCLCDSKNLNKKKNNSICIVRRGTNETENTNKFKYRNRRLNSELNSLEDSDDSVIENDEEIFIYMSKDNKNSQIFKKYDINKNDIKQLQDN